MSMQDPFGSTAFSMVEMTAAIQDLPTLYGRIGQLGLFANRGVSTRSVIVDERDGVLGLLSSAPWGAPGSVGTGPSRRVRSFAIPHFPHDDLLLPDEVQGQRAFGSESSVETVATRVAEKLQIARNKHDITLEYLRMGALKGLVVDGSGTTLIDLWTEYGIAQPSFGFGLNNTATDVRAKVLNLKRHMEDCLRGEMMSGIRALVSAEFFDEFTHHPNVEAAYANWQAAQDRLAGDKRAGFEFAGVIFEEYRATATDTAGASQRFIAAGDGYAFPLGTSTVFQTVYAPADFNETVNTMGQPYYAKSEPRKFGRGYDIHTQSNPLPLVLKPKLAPKLVAH